ncbi:hypothetical protein ACRUJ1_16265, partial [Burkholderia pseudomallei]
MKALSASLLAAILALPSFAHAQAAPAAATPAAGEQPAERASGAILNDGSGAPGTPGTPGTPGATDMPGSA